MRSFPSPYFSGMVSRFTIAGLATTCSVSGRKIGGPVYGSTFTLSCCVSAEEERVVLACPNADKVPMRTALMPVPKRPYKLIENSREHSAKPWPSVETQTHAISSILHACGNSSTNCLYAADFARVRRRLGRFSELRRCAPNHRGGRQPLGRQ